LCYTVFYILKIGYDNASDHRGVAMFMSGMENKMVENAVEERLLKSSTLKTGKYMPKQPRQPTLYHRQEHLFE
jgi:hypothetical protein